MAICIVLIVILAAAFAGLGFAYMKTRSELLAQAAVNRAKESELAAQRETLKSEFATLAATLLNEKQSSLARTNADSVQTLFADLKAKLDRYEKEIRTSVERSAEMDVQMKAHVESLQRFSRETKSFIDVLKGSNRIQGKLGEQILEEILEKSELKSGEHYDTQFADIEAGSRPDAIVYDRNHHAVIIDAKMNIADLVAAYNLPNDPEHHAARERLLREHARSVRAQIDNLAGKDYAHRVKPREGYENLPLVAMFCPFNAILEAALEADPGLLQYACERNIAIITPITLWGYLWLVAWGWKQYGVETRYAEIQELGGDVLTQLGELAADMELVREQLGKACASYDDFYRRATSEKGSASIKRVAAKLMACGLEPGSKRAKKQFEKP